MCLRQVLAFSSGRHEPFPGGLTLAIQATDTREKTNTYLTKLRILKNRGNQKNLKNFSSLDSCQILFLDYCYTGTILKNDTTIIVTAMNTV